MKKKRIKNEGGFVLIQAVMLVVVATIVIGGMISMSRFGLNESKLDLESTQAKQLGYSVMEQVKYNISETFYKYYMASPSAQTTYKLRWFDTIHPDREQVGFEGKYYTVPKNARFTHDDSSSEDVVWRRDGRYTVSLDVRTPESDSLHFAGPGNARDVKITVNATVGGTTRTFEEIVRYKISADFFRYAYFSNQPMSVKGGGDSFVVNGDLRSNGNLTIPDTGVTLAGHLYASINPIYGNDGIGSITGGEITAVTLEDYNSNANTSQQARPVYIENIYENGYTGAAKPHPGEPTVEIPAKGDLQPFREQAVKSNGFIKQNGKIIVSQIYESDEVGYDTIAGTPDDGTLVLDGTKGPIEVHGTVVVEGDVIIKGTFKGQGTVYAARNIHVIDDVTYQQRPIWNKGGQLPDPDSDKDNKSAEAEYERNGERDLIGWIAKGNIIIGNPEHGSNMNQLGPLFNNDKDGSHQGGHITDESDFNNGYDSDGNPANGFFFNGDYTATDGGQRIEVYERDEMNLDNRFFIPTFLSSEKEVLKPVWNGEYKQQRVRDTISETWVPYNSISSDLGQAADRLEGVNGYYVREYSDWRYEQTNEKVYDYVSYDPPQYTTTNGSKINNRVVEPGESVSAVHSQWLDTPDRGIVQSGEVQKGDTITVTAFNADGTVAGTVTRVVNRCHDGGILLNSRIPSEYYGKEFRVTVAERPRVYKDRKYYEPSITTDQMEDLAGNSKPSVMDGIFFTNHLFGGIAQNLVVNGSVITRDSGMFYNRVTFNWDIRLAEGRVNNQSVVDTGLPKTYSDPKTLYRREL